MYLGIDIGTSGIKTTIVDGAGNILAHSYQALQVWGMQEKKRELDPVQVETKMYQALAEVLSCNSHDPIKMITISSLGEAVIPIDRDGKVLARSIIGSDPRGAEELEGISRTVGSRITEITGLNESYIYSVNKILYIRKQEPQLHQKVWKYLCFSDYIGYLLTGETKIDYSMASRTMIFDIHAKVWSPEILAAAGLEKKLFSDPVPGGTIIGSLLDRVKDKLGLSYDIPVMAGSHDHIFNALGAGAVEPGVCSNVVGTTEGLTVVLERQIAADRIRKHQISCQPFVRPGMYNTVAWHNTAGAIVNWYLDTFYAGAANDHTAVLSDLTRELTTDPSDLMVLPHFSGSTTRCMDEKAKGAIIGLTTTTSREEIYKAALEGACYECRILLDECYAAGIGTDKMIVSGGGSKSALWLQLKANILGRPVYRSACADTGALGGAVLAAVISGQYSSLSEAAGKMIKPGQLIEPGESAVRRYGERYEEYRELYHKLRPINHQL